MRSVLLVLEGRVVATLLKEMNNRGSEDNNGCEAQRIVLATPNWPKAINSALQCPERFDREIEIDNFLLSINEKHHLLSPH